MGAKKKRFDNNADKVSYLMILYFPFNEKGIIISWSIKKWSLTVTIIIIIKSYLKENVDIINVLEDNSYCIRLTLLYSFLTMMSNCKYDCCYECDEDQVGKLIIIKIINGIVIMVVVL